MPLAGKRILLGVTGGIAAYKTPALVRLLRAEGADVAVVLSRSAAQFVTATTLQAVSNRPVRTDLFDAAAEAAMGHIELARWADLVLIAPATAHCLMRLAQGAADDLLSTLCLATTSPIAVAPAMNNRMWLHPATVRNVARLRADGVIVLGPASGEQACGEVGPGRMLEPDEIVRAVDGLLTPGPLTGIKAMVTAGPTREPLDPVRYISNHSSGKQGYAMAAALAAAGAQVTLVSGPVSLTPPAGVDVVSVTTACEMLDAVMARIAEQTLFVGVAAVADYRPARTAPQKMKKRSGAVRAVELVENPDIVAAVAATKGKRLVVGFAAETEDTIANARDKLVRKGLDLIAVNDVSDRTIGFEGEHNAVTLVTEDGCEHIARTSKHEIARAITDRIASMLAARGDFEIPSAR